MMEPVPVYVRVVGSLLAVVAVLILGFSLLAGTVSAAAIVASVHKTTPYAVGDAPRLHLDVQYGPVIVEAGRDGRIVVDDQRSAGFITRAGAGAAASQAQVSISHQAKEVSIRETTPLVQGASINRSALLRVQVPAHTNLDITSLDAVTVTGVEGNMKIRSAYARTAVTHATLRGDSTIDGGFGNVNLDDVTVSGTATLKSALGNVVFAGSLLPGGTTLSIDAGRFNKVSITLPHPTDARATVTTRLGNLHANPVWHFSSVQSRSNRSWTADLGPNPSGTVNVTADAGNVDFGAR